MLILNYKRLKQLDQCKLQKLIDNKQLVLSQHCDNCRHRKSKCGFLDETVFGRSELKEIAEECELFETESEE